MEVSKAILSLNPALAGRNDAGKAKAQPARLWAEPSPLLLVEYITRLKIGLIWSRSRMDAGFS
jgi:hypothetical protein